VSPGSRCRGIDTRSRAMWARLSGAVGAPAPVAAQVFGVPGAIAGFFTVSRISQQVPQGLATVFDQEKQSIGRFLPYACSLI